MRQAKAHEVSPGDVIADLLTEGFFRVLRILPSPEKGMTCLEVARAVPTAEPQTWEELYDLDELVWVR